ncbi:MAG TPA: DUF3551 domain-containing protein [Bradyrhizobium sp.]|nr:DUF3551 domain-containing protein [Bradyrhizobium sp.]
MAGLAPLRCALALIPFALVAIPTGGAAAQDFPFCLKGCDFGNGDCSFLSYQQCLATASGRDAWCDANSSFRQGREPKGARYSRRRL